MKPKTILAALLLAVIMQGAATTPPASRLAGLDWLLGSWKRETAKHVTWEHWQRLSDHLYTGQSYRIATAGGDTVYAEDLLLVEMAGEVFYIAKVPENTYPVPFKLSAGETSAGAAFENTEHDFPQRIIYNRRDDGSMTVVLSGPANGETRQVELHFTRE